jgi:DNA-binding transcriptional LysR family regulator
MRLEDLDVFRAVHETGNFQRAALRCGLSQSAVTKVVRKLEDEFGVQLMERGGRSLALTPAGRTLYQRAMELSALATATRRDMAGETAALRGAIRLGVVPALLGSVAAPVLADMLPGPHSVQLLVSVKHSAELVRMLEEGKLDLAVCFGVQHLPPDVLRTQVGPQRYRLVVRAGHPLAGGVPSMEHLSKSRWLLPTSDVTLRTEVERMFADAGFGALDVRVETDTSATLLIPLLRQSDLITVLPEQAFQPLAGEGLAALDLDLQALTGEVTVYHRRKTPSVGLLMELKHRLEAQARSNSLSGRRGQHSARESM